MASEAADGTIEGVRAAVTERQVALGMVTEWSAMMEDVLRGAFCALVGSKYAAIVGGGQSVTWLREQCDALTKAHSEITAEQRKAIRAALVRCKAADEDRNALVHGVKTYSREDGDGGLRTLRSRFRQYEPQVRDWTPTTIHAAAQEMAEAGWDLFEAIEAAVGPELMDLGNALAWEHQARGSA
jgi:hypothetical protein